MMRAAVCNESAWNAVADQPHSSETHSGRLEGQPSSTPPIRGSNQFGKLLHFISARGPSREPREMGRNVRVREGGFHAEIYDAGVIHHGRRQESTKGEGHAPQAGGGQAGSIGRRQARSVLFCLWSG